MMQDHTAKRQLKAQFWSIDIVFALVIFGVAITILSFTWYNITNQLSVASGGSEMMLELQAKSLASGIMSTGSPSNWQSSVNTTNTASWGNFSIGLLSSGTGSSLSDNKLYTMIAMANGNYLASKQPLGVAFDYFVVISSSPSNGAGINITIGRDPQANKALTTYVERRSSVLNGVPVMIKMIVWTNTTATVS